MSGFVLDAGALIAFERSDRLMTEIMKRVGVRKQAVVVPAGVVGQVWRDGRLQVRLARLLSEPHVEIESLDDERAREAGQLCGVRNTADVIDASVVLCARRRTFPIVTSDPDDLAMLDPRVELVVV